MCAGVVMCAFARLVSVSKGGHYLFLAFLCGYCRGYCGVGFPQVVSVGWINMPAKKQHNARAALAAKIYLLRQKKSRRNRNEEVFSSFVAGYLDWLACFNHVRGSTKHFAVSRSGSKA